jgi:ATP-dependent helicase/DNAse subunit B
MLLIGPPGSGKSHRILEAVRDRLRKRNAAFRLLVPTSTMAEHVRHSLAREGFVFRPDLISTLTGFLNSLEPGVEPLSPVRLRFLLRQSLARLCPKVFEALREAPGFVTALASTMEEAASAGVDPGRLQAALDPALGRIPQAFAALYADVAAQAEAAGYGFRNRLLAGAAARVRAQGIPGIEEVFADGFFSFTDPELDFLEALAGKCKLTVSLPDWPGAKSAWLRLTLAGLKEERLEGCRRQPEVELVEAETQEREAEEIALRILEHAARGVRFREIGILVRQHDPYVPLLCSTLGRFGIPVRAYFSGRLSDHAMVRYCRALIQAALSGWDHEKTLAALAMNPSGLPGRAEFERFARAVRERLPGSGLAGLRELAGQGAARQKLDGLAALEGWAASPATPEEWSKRLAQLAGLVDFKALAHGTELSDALAFRRAAAATEAFERCVEEAASVLPETPVDLSAFWEEAEAALRITPLAPLDRRRNVVHLLEVHEARQWELPVVFVCGLLERQFPLHHAQNPFLDDEARRELQRAGFRLATAAEKDAEEEFLFQFSLTRATRSLVLSYPRFNAEGNETLRSFLLDRFLEEHPGIPAARARPARPAPNGSKPPERLPRIVSEDLAELLAKERQPEAPTAIEDFLQCPFLFFARRTLALEEAPARPEQRLDALFEGQVVHTVLEQCLHRPGELGRIFEEVFRRYCSGSGVPPGYRTEAVRLALFRDLRRFVKKLRLEGAEPGLAERPYTLELDGGLTLRCKLDRIDTVPGVGKLIIDYKYRTLNGVKELTKERDPVVQIQAGIYMAALEQAGETCAGFLFAALRGEQGWAGWQITKKPVKGAAESKPEDLRAIMQRAAEAAVEAVERIRQGVIAPKPADPERCETCAYCDICRVESAVQVAVAGGESSE